MSICYNFSFSFWGSLGFGEKLGFYLRVRRYKFYLVVTLETFLFYVLYIYGIVRSMRYALQFLRNVVLKINYSSLIS